MLIYKPRFGIIALRRDSVTSLPRSNVLSDGLRTVSLIADDVAPSDFRLSEQGHGMAGIMVIAGTEQERQRIA